MAEKGNKDKTKRSLPVWAKVLVAVVVFCSTALFASYLLMPAWMIERRLMEGELTEDDVERMHANLGGYIHMTGNAMVEAAENENIELLFRLSEFMLGTLEDVNTIARGDHAPMAGWIHLGTAQRLNREYLEQFLVQIGASSDVRIQALCTTFEQFSEEEDAPHLGAVVLELLNEGLTNQSEAVHQIAFINCRPALISALIVWLESADPPEATPLAMYLGGLLEFGGLAMLDTAVHAPAMMPQAVLRILETLHQVESNLIVAESAGSGRLERINDLGAFQHVLGLVTSPDVLVRPEWFEPVESGGAPAISHVLDRVGELTTPLERYSLASRFLLAAPPSHRDVAHDRFAATAEETRAAVIEQILPTMAPCFDAIAPEQVQDVVVRLQPAGGAVVTATLPDGLQACLQSSLEGVNLPGQDRLAGEFVLEYP